MNPIKFVKCIFAKHQLDTPSIVNTICRNNWLKKCSCCGMYIMHGESGAVLLTEKQALKVKRDFEKAFPYMKEEGDVE